MAKPRNDGSAEFPNGHLTDVQENYLLPPQIIDLEKHNGLHGDQIAPGFRKIIKADTLPDGAINIVLDHVEGKHQHWQKFLDSDGKGYWQNVEGQVQRHRKANPIQVLVGTHKIDDNGNLVKVAKEGGN